MPPSEGTPSPKRQRVSPGYRAVGAASAAAAEAPAASPVGGGGAGVALGGAAGGGDGPATPAAVSGPGCFTGVVLWLDSHYLGKGKKSKETLQLNSWLRAVPQCGGAVVTDGQAAGRCTHAVHHSRAGSWVRLPDGLRAGVQHVQQSWLTDSLLKGRRMEEAAHRPPSPPSALAAASSGGGSSGGGSSGGGMGGGSSSEAGADSRPQSGAEQPLSPLLHLPLSQLPLSLLSQLPMSQLSKLALAQLPPAQLRGMLNMPPRYGLQDVFSVLSWNLWCSPVCAEERMAAFGQAVRDNQWPDFLVLQEVPPLFWDLLQEQPWFRFYDHFDMTREGDKSWGTGLAVMWRRDSVKSVRKHSVFRFETMNNEAGMQWREITWVSCEVGGTTLRLGNTHVELHNCGGRNQFFEALEELKTVPERNCLIAGDFNWVPMKRDFDPRLPEGFVDVWIEWYSKTGKAPAGFTWGGKTTQKGEQRLTGARLDRAYARLPDWDIALVEVVGTKPIPGLTRDINTKARGLLEGHPVWVSDHHGLYMRYSRP